MDYTYHSYGGIIHIDNQSYDGRVRERPRLNGNRITGISRNHRGSNKTHKETKEEK